MIALTAIRTYAVGITDEFAVLRNAASTAKLTHRMWLLPLILLQVSQPCEMFAALLNDVWLATATEITRYALDRHSCAESDDEPDKANGEQPGYFDDHLTVPY